CVRHQAAIDQEIHFVDAETERLAVIHAEHEATRCLHHLMYLAGKIRLALMVADDHLEGCHIRDGALVAKIEGNNLRPLGEMSDRERWGGAIVTRAGDVL